MWPLPLRRAGGLNPGPSLEGGLEELRELRERINLLLLGLQLSLLDQDEGSDGSWSRLPVRF